MTDDSTPLIERYIPRDWVFPIVLATFVGVLVWFGHSVQEFLLPGPNSVTVPSFVGLTTNDATNAIIRANLKPAIAGHAVSAQYPKGVIMNQQPQAGMHVRAGRQISLVVSDGVQTELMPDLRYQSLRDARLDLSQAHLVLAKTQYMRSDDIPADHVISQNPAPSVSVTEGTNVSLLVSKGGFTSIKVPNFVGLDIDAARGLAANLHIKLGQIVWTPLGPSAPPHGEVVHQKPDAGTTIGPYDTLALNVSAGPHESGYIIHQTHVLAAVPPAEAGANQALRVRFSVSDATGAYDLYNGYAQPGQKFDLNVTTIGTSAIYFFVNDTLLGETKVGQEPPNAYESRPGPKPGATP
ncbi:MAG TPA: PASTA domain-containing protein [Candidatus Rubrimentiphilum sp.]|nr:PASTA domain-containing protein [Candidatus Rubrimentiphilum sp.]